MRKKISVIFLLTLVSLILQACYDIDDNRRVLVNGTVVDENNTPVSNIVIESRGSSVVLGATTTDTNGDFEFTSLESTAIDFSIYLNAKPVQDSNYASTRFINQDSLATPTIVKTKQRSKQLYDLGKIVLRHVQNFKFEIIKKQNTQDTLYYTFNIPEVSCTTYLSDTDSSAGQSECFAESALKGRILPEEDSFNIHFMTLVNTEAVFNYHINQGMVQQIRIPVNQSTSGYVFQY